MTRQPIQKSICLEMIYEERPFLDRVDRVAELGADTIEFWTWRDKDLDAIANRVDQHDLDIAGFVATEDAELTNPDDRGRVVDDLEASIETAVQLDVDTLIVLVGDEQADRTEDEQYESIVAGLREAAPAAEDAGVSLLVEPLNTLVDHPGYFLETTADGRAVVEAVDSSGVGLLFDIYHQQVAEGNVTQRVLDNLDVIEHLHIADVPGRHEPDTGELNYENIIDMIADAGYEGYFGFEFRPESDSDAAVEHVLSL